MMAERGAGGLRDRLGHDFTDPELLRLALTPAGAIGNDNNERLEFLGDRVLGLTVAEMLLDRFADESEGEIGRRFAALVRADTLIEIGREVGIDEALIGMRGAVADSAIADAVEAVIAALYRDGGQEVAAAFIRRYWTPRMDNTARPPRDAKTALQEWSQGRGLGLPEYRNVARSGPDHAPEFTVAVAVEGTEPEQATGSSKRAAEQAAASRLLERLGVAHDH